VSLPGLAFACAIRSATELMFALGLAVSSSVPQAASEIGEKSTSGS